MADQKKVVFEYLEALLSDPEQEQDALIPESDKNSTSELVQDSPVQSTLPAEPEPEPEPGLDTGPVEDSLRCILVDVHGLKLAIPTDDVDGVQEVHSLTMSIEMHHDWMIGHFGRDECPTTVVDTGLWVIPGSYSVDKADYTDVLILKGRRWALACNQIIKSIDLPRSAININQDKDHRAWLYGTCLVQRCAVLDTDQLIEEFEVMIV